MPALPASAAAVVRQEMNPSKSSCFGAAKADFEGEWTLREFFQTLHHFLRVFSIATPEESRRRSLRLRGMPRMPEGELLAALSASVAP
jgi:hypothetical protein